jgi:hypothetical protein
MMDRLVRTRRRHPSALDEWPPPSSAGSGGRRQAGALSKWHVVAQLRHSSEAPPWRALSLASHLSHVSHRSWVTARGSPLAGHHSRRARADSRQRLTTCE